MTEVLQAQVSEQRDPVPTDGSVTEAGALPALDLAQNEVATRLADLDWRHAGAVSGGSGDGPMEAAIRKARK